VAFLDQVPCPDAKEMQEAIMAVAGQGRNINSQWFGRWLETRIDQSYGGLTLRRRYDSHAKVGYYYVEAASTKGEFLP
jgi:hypothetical protein